MEMQFPVILDGATGTELQKRGFTGDMSAEQWVLEHPESILEIQRKYVASGSNVLYAPTFGGNRQKLEERGIFNRTEEMNKALAQLSKQAADGKAAIAGRNGKISAAAAANSRIVLIICIYVLFFFGLGLKSYYGAHGVSRILVAAYEVCAFITREVSHVGESVVHLAAALERFLGKIERFCVFPGLFQAHVYVFCYESAFFLP